MEIWKPQLTFTAQYFEANESWVAVRNGTRVAFETLLEKDGSAWLENLWVSPAWIGKGVGKSLFLQLEADPNAAGFYEKMGIHRIGERHSEVEGQRRSLPMMEIQL